jgi:nitrogen fixation NifU-like protein
VSERINKLYPEAIRTHNEQPYHFGKQDYAPSVKAYNPVCGDKFEIYVKVGDGVISEIHFYGLGCAISKASTSILVKSLEGKGNDEALRICDSFLRFVDNTLDPHEPLNEELKSFSALHEFPERRECATLSWTEMRKHLESKIENKRYPQS